MSLLEQSVRDVVDKHANHFDDLATSYQNFSKQLAEKKAELDANVENLHSQITSEGDLSSVNGSRRASTSTNASSTKAIGKAEKQLEASIHSLLSSPRMYKGPPLPRVANMLPKGAAALSFIGPGSSHLLKESMRKQQAVLSSFIHKFEELQQNVTEKQQKERATLLEKAEEEMVETLRHAVKSKLSSLRDVSSSEFRESLRGLAEKSLKEMDSWLEKLQHRIEDTTLTELNAYRTQSRQLSKKSLYEIAEAAEENKEAERQKLKLQLEVWECSEASCAIPPSLFRCVPPCNSILRRSTRRM